MGVYAGPDISENGLVLHLDAGNSKSYPGSGNTWTDLSGNGYGKNLVNGITYSASPDKFDTNATIITDQNHLSTSSTITFTDASAYTFDFYIKLRTNAQSTFHSLLGWGSTNPWLSIYTNNTLGTSWYVAYRENSAIYRNGNNITNYNIQQNWINITLSVDTSRNVNIYFNGVFNQTLNPTSTLFYVNRIAGGYSSGGNYHSLQGSLASCKLYNRALSAQEIQQNFNATRGRFGV